MLCIRLQRTGNKNNPTFRLVAADKRSSAKKNPKEILGHYLPTRDPSVFEFKKDRVEHYLSNGAVPSDTVARLLSKAGVKNLEKYMERYTKKRKKNAPPEEEAPPAPPPAAAEEPQPQAEVTEVAEEPKEEAPAEEEKPVEEATS
ncbi:30S ribosomal protein S16 [Candidatus Peribacteria bacterium]|nr:30S ribosomal protein S16 [Candidatus Peribacteria bacterium]